MKRILLVDDDDTLHRKVRPWLIKAGYAVDHAGNSLEAKNALRLAPAERKIDIIVCDNSMVTENEGLEFGVSLWLIGAPQLFILYTASDLPESQTMMQRHKIGYVKKADTPDDLLAKLAEVIEKESAAL
jgi:DNA-binding NtrC family response regulator